MSAPAIRVALVGCGDIGETQHLPALVRDGRFAVVAVADAEPGRAERVGARFGVDRRLLDAADALALAPDAVVLATPPHVTPVLARQALEAGVHVLCEKPLAVSLGQADAVVEAALGTSAVLQVGFKNRFAPLVQRLRAWVRNGRLGSPLAVRIGAFDERYDPTDSVHSERIQGFLEHGPPVVHEGAHSADLLLWLLGPVARVHATALRSRPEFPSPNLHAALLEHADGSRARLEVGWWFPQLWPGEVELYGPVGSAVLSRPDGRLTFGDGRAREVVEDAEDWQTACFRGQLDAFATAIAGGPRTGASAAEGRAALALTLAVVEAAERGAPVELGPP